MSAGTVSAAQESAEMAGAAPACRFCATPLTLLLVDLGATPLANSHLPPPA